MTPEKLATDVEAPIIQTWSALDHPTSSPFFLSLSLFLLSVGYNYCRSTSRYEKKQDWTSSIAMESERETY